MYVGGHIAPIEHPPMVVMIVPEKKKALARSHWLTKLRLLMGSTPAPTASTTSWDGNGEEEKWLVHETASAICI